ncbi:MAG: DedA family protein [Propionicimonas sp.]|uniref:DedA family protein n=1 Tax=Propionicimonas sp. TaxID=1955623 RepID=UPI003D0F6985
MTADQPSDEPTEPAGEPASGAAGEWWDDPSLPWKHKPTRADIACFSWLGVVAVYGIVINILRPGLLGSAPHVLASLGSWSGSVLVGAMARIGDPWWPLVWLLGTLGLVKFDWIYWWAGRLWGRELIEVWSGRSERARRTNEWASRFARKYETLALVISMVPGVPGRGVVVAVLGEAGTSLAKFLTVSLATSAVVVGGCLAAGYWIGEPAVAVMQTYGSYLWYVSLALLVLVVVQYVRTQRKRPTEA